MTIVEWKTQVGPTNDMAGLSNEQALCDRVPHLERLLAQRGFFDGPFDRVSSGAYAQSEGDVLLGRSRAVLEPRSHVTQNTYFGRFPASYWQRWTSVEETVLEASVTGSGRITVRATDRDGVPRTLHSRVVTDAAMLHVRMKVSIDRFVDGGAVWAEFSTEDDRLEVDDVRWTVEPPSKLRPTALVMCTFNRADDCLFTLGVLIDDAEARLMVDAVYVIDQGDDTLDSRAAFADITADFGKALRYRRQPNLGGAGGFTRGLYEVVEVADADHANIMFMDDDILLEPDVVVRLTAFANRTVEPTVVGAQMLHLLHPNKMHVGAETANFTAIEPGKPVPGALSRADITTTMQELRVDADYNAWWTCLIPAEIVADAGYPMPFFFQWDDVEFGYRIRARGHSTVTLPGAAVWHHDFDWKDEDDWARYFTLRNALMIDALHGSFDPKASAKVAGRWIAQCLVSMRYGEAATLIRAVQDFLDGPDSLRDGGARALREVRQLRAAYPETVRHPASCVPGVAGSERRMSLAGPPPSRATAVLAKRLVWHLRGRVHGSAAISARDAHWWHVSLFRTAVVTDASQEGVRVRTFDRDVLVRLGREALKACWRLRKGGNSARNRLQLSVPELTSREHWHQLFGMQDENYLGSTPARGK